jgi:hypothetical protein
MNDQEIADAVEATMLLLLEAVEFTYSNHRCSNLTQFDILPVVSSAGMDVENEEDYLFQINEELGKYSDTNYKIDDDGEPPVEFDPELQEDYFSESINYEPTNKSIFDYRKEEEEIQKEYQFCNDWMKEEMTTIQKRKDTRKNYAEIAKRDTAAVSTIIFIRTIGLSILNYFL